MNITIQNIELDEDYEDLKVIVPFRSAPVRCPSTNGTYMLRPFNPMEHPFWAWVSYKEIEPFKINPRGDSYSSIIDVTLHDVETFTVDYDEVDITFANGTATSFDLPIERYTNISIDAVY